VKDLFFDLQGIESQLFHTETGSDEKLFSDDDYPWEALNKLPNLLRVIVDINPRKIVIGQRNILVERNLDCLYPCVVDVYKQEPPYPYVDPKSLRLRGGIHLKCDGSAKLMGPAYVGPSVHIRHNGGILGYVVLGDGVSFDEEPKEDEIGIGGIIGHGVTVRRSIIRAGTKIEAHSEIVDCIIGKNVYIDAGAQFPHENFSQREVSFARFDSELMGEPPIQTKRKKLGCIIGDRCFVGANVTMHPGTILMPGCRVPGGSVLEAGVYSPQYFFTNR
jgi:UDP-3-O-[3-hydroxymyristoyl] glucosamine N-acyltransferase